MTRNSHAIEVPQFTSPTHVKAWLAKELKNRFEFDLASRAKDNLELKGVPILTDEAAKAIFQKQAEVSDFFNFDLLYQLTEWAEHADLGLITARRNKKKLPPREIKSEMVVQNWIEILLMMQPLLLQTSSGSSLQLQAIVTQDVLYALLGNESLKNAKTQRMLPDVEFVGDVVLVLLSIQELSQKRVALPMSSEDVLKLANTILQMRIQAFQRQASPYGYWEYYSFEDYIQCLILKHSLHLDDISENDILHNQCTIYAFFALAQRVQAGLLSQQDVRTHLQTHTTPVLETQTQGLLLWRMIEARCVLSSKNPSTTDKGLTLAEWFALNDLLTCNGFYEVFIQNAGASVLMNLSRRVTQPWIEHCLQKECTVAETMNIMLYLQKNAQSFEAMNDDMIELLVSVCDQNSSQLNAASEWLVHLQPYVASNLIDPKKLKKLFLKMTADNQKNTVAILEKAQMLYGRLQTLDFFKQFSRDALPQQLLDLNQAALDALASFAGLVTYRVFGTPQETLELARRLYHDGGMLKLGVFLHAASFGMELLQDRWLTVPTLENWLLSFNTDSNHTRVIDMLNVVLHLKKIRNTPGFVLEDALDRFLTRKEIEALTVEERRAIFAVKGMALMAQVFDIEKGDIEQGDIEAQVPFFHRLLSYFSLHRRRATVAETSTTMTFPTWDGPPPAGLTPTATNLVPRQSILS